MLLRDVTVSQKISLSGHYYCTVSFSLRHTVCSLSALMNAELLTTGSTDGIKVGHYVKNTTTTFYYWIDLIE